MKAAANFFPKPLHYLKNLVAFALRNNPLLYLNLPLILVSAGIEILAMSILIPLSTLAMEQQLSESSFWASVLTGLGLPVTPSSLLLLFVVIFSIRIATQLASQSLTFYLGTKIQAELSSQAFTRVVQDYSLREIEDKSVGFFIGIAGDEASRAGTIITSLNQFFALFVLAFLYYLTIFYYSAITGIAVFVFLIVSFVCLIGAFRKSHQLGERQIGQRRTAYSVFLDSLNGLRTIRAFSATEYVSRDYESIISRYARTAFAIEFLNLVARSTPILILLASAGVFVGLGVVKIDTGSQFAFLVTMLIYLMRFFPSVGQCLNIFIRIIADTKAGKDVTAMLSAGGGTRKPHGTQLLTENVSDVTCEGIGFSYGDEKWVLKDLDMRLERGKSYALVGPSGVGKSTLVDLLVGLYGPNRGQIRINGVKIDEIEAGSLRRKVILLGQRTTVFNNTVANNVKMGFEDVSDDEVRDACRVACIDEHICSLRDGYKTILSYQGTNFSGGQLQRLGIARALLRSPDVLVLDESTSAIDASTRGVVVDNILRKFADRIVLLVSHDQVILDKVTTVVDILKINSAPPPVQDAAPLYPVENRALGK